MRDEEVARPYRKVVKKYGIQHRYKVFGKTHTWTRWYKTEKGRDEAMAVSRKQYARLLMFKDVKETKVER